VSTGRQGRKASSLVRLFTWEGRGPEASRKGGWPAVYIGRPAARTLYLH